MKNVILFFSAVIISAAALAQKTIDDANAQTRTVAYFHAIQVSDGIDLYLNQSSAEAVAVSASDERVREKIITKVENGVLKIYYDDRSRMDWHNKKMKAYVSFKTLDELGASGGSDVSVEGSIDASKLVVDISGGSDFHGKVSSSNLQIKASGGSDMYISGTAGSLDLDASGGSDFHGYDLVTDNCKIEASGGSDVDITVNKELNVEASGGSDVQYKGSAVITNMDSSGDSSIKKVS